MRSARQFGRLVQETPPGRAVKATIVRDGQRKDVEITPKDGRRRDGLDFRVGGDFLRGTFGDLDALRDQLPLGPFNYAFDLPGALSGRRLGVSVNPLTDQLAQYFGAKDGVLVTAVADGSVAARAGLRAGDVITSVNGEPIRSRDDLARSLRDAKEDEITIGIVRDRKERTLKAKIEAPQRQPRVVRPV